jgi:hypothetical protein
MGIEWFRDLSIAILGFVASVVLVFMSVILYRLHRVAMSTMQSVETASQGLHDTVNLVQAVIEPLFPIVALIQGLRGGFKGFGRMFKKEYEGGKRDE